MVLEIIELLEQLENLVTTTEPLRPHASTDKWEVTSGLLKSQKQVTSLKSGIAKAYGTVSTIEPTPDLNVCVPK